MVNKSFKEVDGNRVPQGHDEAPTVDHDELEDSQEVFVDQLIGADQPLTLNLARTLRRKLNEFAREEGVTVEDLAAELIAEGVVIRAWEIIEKRATMRGGNNQNFARQNNQGNSGNVNGNNAQSNQSRPTFQGGNKMAHKKLQRQARQHANAMDLMADKAAFLEYVRNQEKKRR